MAKINKDLVSRGCSDFRPLTIFGTGVPVSFRVMFHPDERFGKPFRRSIYIDHNWNLFVLPDNEQLDHVEVGKWTFSFLNQFNLPLGRWPGFTV
jgi:hypothetical protein